MFLLRLHEIISVLKHPPSMDVFFRNVLNPVTVFYFAKLYDASFVQFFWIWVIINWLFSTGYFLFTFNYMRLKLNKSGAVVNP